MMGFSRANSTISLRSRSYSSLESISRGNYNDASAGIWGGTERQPNLVEEVVKQLDVDEHRRGVRKLVSHDVQERLWAKDVVLRARLAPL